MEHPAETAFTAALYELIRTNVPIADPAGNGLFSRPEATGRGFETALTGYITRPGSRSWVTPYGRQDHQRHVADHCPGNRVQLVPYNQFAWWNKYQIDPLCRSPSA